MNNHNNHNQDDEYIMLIPTPMEEQIDQEHFEQAQRHYFHHLLDNGFYNNTFKGYLILIMQDHYAEHEIQQTLDDLETVLRTKKADEAYETYLKFNKKYR